MFCSINVRGRKGTVTSLITLRSGDSKTLIELINLRFSSVQSLSHVWIFVTPWTATRQASLSNTNSRSLPKLMSIEPVMPSNHLISCCPLLLLSSIFLSIKSFPMSQLFTSGGQSIGVSALASDQISHSVVYDSLWPHELQHARPPCPTPTSGVHWDSCPWSQWCHPAISSSTPLLFICLQFFPE